MGLRFTEGSSEAEETMQFWEGKEEEARRHHCQSEKPEARESDRAVDIWLANRKTLARIRHQLAVRFGRATYIVK